MPALCPCSHWCHNNSCRSLHSSLLNERLMTRLCLLEPGSRVVRLKYEELGPAMMLMCSSMTVSLWYLLSTPRTCVKVDPCGHQKYSLYASMVQMVIIQLEFLASFAAFWVDLALINYLDWSIGDTTPRSCRTDVANITRSSLSETPVQSQAVVSTGNSTLIRQSGISQDYGLD